jgi:glycosyltransferase involved in cell wall biosynthesis
MTVIMPTYQLGDVIEDNIEVVLDALKTIESELVIVNDGSTDGTALALERAKTRWPEIQIVHLDENHGKGRALLEGWRVSRGSQIVFLDADLDLPPGQIPALLADLDHADIVVGTKRASMAGGGYPGIRRILSRTFALATAGMFRLPVSETQTGLKAFRREVLDRVADKVRIDRYAFDLELLARAHSAGFTMVERPVQLGSGAATSSLRASMMWTLGRDTIRIAWWRLTEPDFRR